MEIITGLLISLIILILPAICVILIVRRAKLDKKIKDKQRLKESVLTLEELCSTEFDYNPDWARVKKERRARFHTEEDVRTAMECLRNKKGEISPAGETELYALKYADVEESASLYLSELYDNSAEWESVADRVKSAYPKADTSDWDTLEGFFNYACHYCLNCGAPLKRGNGRYVRFGYVYGRKEKYTSYKIDTGMRIGSLPVYKTVSGTSVDDHAVIKEGKMLKITSFGCSSHGETIFYEEEKGMPVESVYYTDVFLPIKPLVSEKLYDFLSRPSYMPFKDERLPQTAFLNGIKKKHGGKRPPKRPILNDLQKNS